VIENFFETVTFFDHPRDDSTIKEKRLIMPSVEAEEHAQAIHQVTYYRRWTANFQWEMKGMRQENDQVILAITVLIPYLEHIYIYGSR
jgi:hypothetical protein